MVLRQWGKSQDNLALMALNIRKLLFNPFNSHEWPRQNFSLQSLHNISQISDETKEKYQFGIISWSNTKFSELTLKNCMVDSKENYKFDLRVKGLRNEYESDLCSNEHYLNRQ